ncbi:hypothetical protein OH492_27600 [Vibrio chagasii]|nr:hypothetical protein [Vibrio chagasii]
MEQIDTSAKQQAEYQLARHFVSLRYPDQGKWRYLTIKLHATTISDKGVVTATVPVLMVNTIHLPLPNYDTLKHFKNSKHCTLYYSAFLWCVPFGLFCYWVATF